MLMLRNPPFIPLNLGGGKPYIVALFEIDDEVKYVAIFENKNTRIA